MSDPTFMSASELRREVVLLREGIRRHLLAINPDGVRTFPRVEDIELWDLLEGVDDV